MIYVIGTCHKTQLWTDLVTKRALGAAPLSKVAAFQKFVRDAAVTLQATIIAEELSEDTVLDYGYHAESVAAVIARDLDLRHILCEPSPRDGHLFADPTPAVAESPPGTVSERFAMRENWWARRLAPFSPNTTIVVFICGVAHCETFPETAEAERPRSSGLLPGRTPRRHCYQGCLAYRTVNAHAGPGSASSWHLFFCRFGWCRVYGPPNQMVLVFFAFSIARAIPSDTREMSLVGRNSAAHSADTTRGFEAGARLDFSGPDAVGRVDLAEPG